MTNSAQPKGRACVDPTNGETIAFHPFVEDGALEGLIARAHDGFLSWSHEKLSDRLSAVAKFAAAMRQNNEKLARQATLEMGKPIAAARAEVEKCASLCDWYVKHAEQLLADKSMQVPSGKACLTYAPLGTILGVMPWNFPYWQLLRAAIPITVGGNGFLVKPAENTFGCAALLGDLAEESGYHRAFIVANLTREHCVTALGDPRIAGVSLTGSLAAGRSLAATAGKNVKKAVLELGGADPFIVLADADLDAAVKAAVTSRFGNCGQVCIAAKRLIVEEPIRARFTEAFVGAVKAIVPSDPMLDDTFLGPMARIDLRDGLHEQVLKSISEGAHLLLGGEPIEGAGAWYRPTVLDGVTPGMTAFDDELFGPVASIVAARDADHAVELANNNEYGLSASIWTQNAERARAIAQRLESGSVFINKISASDPHVPIGGVKNSGYGRELTQLGLHEFMNIKTIWAA